MRSDRQWFARRRRGRAPVRRPVGKPLEFDEADRLRLAVFGDDEVAGRQAINRAAVLVLDAHGLDDQPGSRTKPGWCLLCAERDAQQHQRGQSYPSQPMLVPTPLSSLSSVVASLRDFHQKRTRREACTLRIGLAVVGRPNCGLPTDVLPAANVTWFRTLVALSRQSRLSRSPHMNVRPMPASSRNCGGPAIEFRPALPHSPAAGVMYANGF